MIALAFIGAAAVGTLVRWQATARLPTPLGTLSVNVVGAFALGWLTGASEATHTVVGIAALGSLTTFSTLVVEILELARAQPRRAVAYLGVTLAAGIGAASLGLALA